MLRHKKAPDGALAREAGLEMGLTTFKFFPSEAMNGMATIKQLCGPYSGIQFIPTGGITLSNMEDYLSSDKIAAVGGSFMAPAALEGAKAGVEATKEMTPKYGKAAVFAAKALGTEDQGATAGMLLVQGLYNGVQSEGAAQ